MKLCAKCGAALFVDNWPQHRRDAYDYICNPCEKERRTKYREGNVATYLWGASKKRSQYSNIPFEISPADIIVPELCPVLGLKLEFGTGRAGNGSPSLDRIRPELGYVPGNIEVVSWRANRLKADASPEELRLVSNYYNKGD